MMNNLTNLFLTEDMAKYKIKDCRYRIGCKLLNNVSSLLILFILHPASVNQFGSHGKVS